jgi:hypothetical protein
MSIPNSPSKHEGAAVSDEVQLTDDDQELVNDRILFEQQSALKSYLAVMDEIAEDERKARDQLRRCEIRRRIVNATHPGRTEAKS